MSSLGQALNEALRFAEKLEYDMPEKHILDPDDVHERIIKRRSLKKGWQVGSSAHQVSCEWWFSMMHDDSIGVNKDEMSISGESTKLNRWYYKMG